MQDLFLDLLPGADFRIKTSPFIFKWYLMWLIEIRFLERWRQTKICFPALSSQAWIINAFPEMAHNEFYLHIWSEQMRQWQYNLVMFLKIYFDLKAIFKKIFSEKMLNEEKCLEEQKTNIITHYNYCKLNAVESHWFKRGFGIYLQGDMRISVIVTERYLINPKEETKGKDDGVILE